MDRQRIKERFENLFKRQMKKANTKIFAEKCLKYVDKIIGWYLTNQREMKLKELKQIIK